ncbi:MAG: MFS transporter [Planctomycetota bacterium]|nr:MFS transporter [Planctomycetota bacterium]
MPTDPKRIPRTIWLLASCRFGEAAAVGMLIPTLPLFLGTLTSPAADRVAESLATRFPWLADILPGLATASQEARTAFLFSITGLAMASIQIFAGRFSDRFDTRKPLIVGGMTLGACCSFCLPLLDSYWQLVLLRILQGSFLGLTFPPMMAIIARHAPDDSGGKVLGLYSTIRLLGFGLGPILGGILGDAGGYDLVFLVSGSLLLISVFLVSIKIKDPSEFRTEEERSRPLPPIQPIFRLLGLVIFVMMVGISTVISLFPHYEREFGSTQSELGTMFAIFVATRCLFQYPCGWAGDRYDKKRLLLLGLLLFIPLVILQGHVENLSELTLIRMGLGAVSAMMSTAVGGIYAERSSPGNRARMMGINTLCFSLGTAVGPSLTGFIDSQQIAFMIPAGAAVVLFGSLFFFLPSDRQARSC